MNRGMLEAVLPGIDGALLGGLLDRAGTPGPLSPRPTFGDGRPPRPEEAAELFAAGILERPDGGRIQFTPAFREVSDLLGISRSSVQNHVERGLDRLRGELEVPHV